ncbi:MAG: hypothetical protein JST92_00445 [Deltaproteobacteria bacterium]|nr:hypothetical protein [Deltaproteobacteria bacterium]
MTRTPAAQRVLPWALPLVIAASAVACGGSDSTSTSSGSVSGDVFGTSFPSVAEVEAVRYGALACTSSDMPSSILDLTLDSTTGNCVALGDGRTLPSDTRLRFIITLAANTDVSATTYLLDGGKGQAELTRSDPTCGTPVDYKATGGTLTLSSVTDSGVAGSFRVTFSDGSSTATLVGSFTSGTCAPSTEKYCSTSRNCG